MSDAGFPHALNGTIIQGIENEEEGFSDDKRPEGI